MNIDVKLRYLPLVEFINENKTKDSSILEVGGGSMGISRFLNFNITGCDINFDKSKISNKVNYVKGDVRNLPFEDDSFDFVISSDMIEHIKEEDREKAIKELVRVAKKYVLVGFPCGEKAHNYESKYFNLGKKLIGREHKWIKEHMENGLPNEDKIKEYLKNCDYKILKNSNLNLWICNELFNPYFWFIPWILYPIFKYNLEKGDSYRKIFIISKNEQ